jgi:hypothetical protein
VHNDLVAVDVLQVGVRKNADREYAAGDDANTNAAARADYRIPL